MRRTMNRNKKDMRHNHTPARFFSPCFVLLILSGKRRRGICWGSRELPGEASMAPVAVVPHVHAASYSVAQGGCGASTEQAAVSRAARCSIRLTAAVLTTHSSLFTAQALRVHSSQFTAYQHPAANSSQHFSTQAHQHTVHSTRHMAHDSRFTAHSSPPP